jgi:Pre ATP-grasp domain/ATP-grasp domain
MQALSRKQETFVSVRNLFSSLVPEEQAHSFLWLSNFEAERFWSSPSDVRLPQISQPEQVAIANRLEEMSLFIAESPDYVILREPSDPDYLEYLATDLGLRVPTILTPGSLEKETPISELVLSSSEFCARLSTLNGTNGKVWLLPFAKTRLEEQIAETTGIAVLQPSASVCEKINSKIYSRRMSKHLGLKTIDGWECESLQDIENAFEDARENLSRGEKYVLKESMGVSGKGLFLVDGAAKVQHIRKLLKRKDKAGNRFSFVVEKWVDKLKDINYLIFISGSGEVRLLSIKEIATDGGVHMGHRFPADLSDHQLQTFEEAAQLIGQNLFRDGFVGIAGIDSIIDAEGEVYPLLEINARFNMSTFQVGIERLAAPNFKAIAKYYPLSLTKRLDFLKLKNHIDSHLLKLGGDGYGVIIQNFATVNVNYTDDGQPFPGRLYVLIIEKSFAQADLVDQQLTESLRELQSA